MHHVQGNAKIISFPGGIYLDTPNPGEGYVNRGILEPRIYSDEKATMDNHKAMVEEFMTFMEQYESILYGGDIILGSSGDDVCWTMDFSNIEFVNKLESRNVPRLLRELF